jgi:hypothetical protein
MKERESGEGQESYSNGREIRPGVDLGLVEVVYQSSLSPFANAGCPDYVLYHPTMI